jgi:hypothetical protein
MIDLAVGVLTYQGSKWDAVALRNKLSGVLSKSGISSQVLVFYNQDEFSLKPLTPLQYLRRVVQIHNRIFAARIQRAATYRVFFWFLRQQGATLISMLKLLSSKHRVKISTEATRASRISGGHHELLKALSKIDAKLFLILEDDVDFDPQAGPTSLIWTSLLQLDPIKNGFSCELSASFSFKELGVDDGHRDRAGSELRRHTYTFTNTLAATVVSLNLLKLTLAELSREHRSARVQFDYELSYVWSGERCKAISYSALKPLFWQRSDFKSIKVS